MRIAILGVGEAGSRFALDLAGLDVDVRTWDPDPARRVDGIEAAASPAAAVAGCEVVLSLNSAAAALDAARAALPALATGQVYADLNSAAPALKRELDEVVSGSGALFTDAALLGRCRNVESGLRYSPRGAVRRGSRTSSGRSRCPSRSSTVAPGRRRLESSSAASS